MKLYVDLETLNFIEGIGFRNPLTSINLKRGDSCDIQVQFVRDGSVVELASGATGALGLKVSGDYDGGFVDRLWRFPAPS